MARMIQQIDRLKQQVREMEDPKEQARRLRAGQVRRWRAAQRRTVADALSVRAACP
jgi:hypothetical protein